LVIGHVWPEPKTTAAGQRMLQLLTAFQSFGCTITFASTATKTEFSVDLKAMGVAEVAIEMNNASFDHFVAELRPELVIFDRFMVEEQFGWRIADHCPEALRILNTEDLHSLRETRAECFKKEKDFEIADWLNGNKTKREIASIFRSDVTLLVSEEEVHLLKEHIGINDKLLLLLPFMLDEINEETTGKWPDFSKRTDFITFGNGRHLPNVDAINYLKREIWPMIRKRLPEANVHVYGAYLPDSVKIMHNPEEGFLVHGWIDDLEAEVKKRKVLLAPLRFGAGIKGKLTLAMQNGTPNMTTSIGYEGMAYGESWGGMVADTPQEFAQKAVKLYLEEPEWTITQEHGIELINTHYAKANLQKRLYEAITNLRKTLAAHRTQNFIGQMLQHQANAATKYMGKWIEEKSKN